MKSKKVLFGVALLGAVTAACALTACKEKAITPVNNEFKPTLGYQLPYRETDAGVTIDGKLDDEVYKNQNWLHCQKDYGFEHADIDMVTYFGAQGIYVGVTVEENSGIYFNPVKATTDNSCIELYLSLGGVSSIDDLRKCFEIDMCCDGTINLKQKLISGIWTSILGTNDARVTYAAKTIGGDYNTPECTGYTCELFIPFEFLEDCRAIEAGETVSEIYCNPALITSYGYESDAKRHWFDIAGYNISSYSWGIPSSAYVFDGEGLVSKTINIETNKGGKIEESRGYGYLIPGSTVEFNLTVDDGYTIESLLVNGKDRKGAITVDNDRVYLLLSNVTEDLDINVQYKPIAATSHRLTGGISYSGKADFNTVLNDLRVRAFDGFHFYDVNYSAEDNSFAKTLPEGEYEIIVSSVSGGYEIMRESVNLTGDEDKEITFTDKEYGDTRNIKMTNVLVMGGGYKAINLPGKVTSDKFINTFYLGLSDDARSITEQTYYVNNYYLRAASEELRLQIVKWGNASDSYSIKFVDLNNGVAMSNNVRDALIKNNGLYFAIVRNGTSVTLYAEGLDGSMESIVTRKVGANAQFNSVALECAEGCDSLHPSMIRDIAFVQGTTSFDDLPNMDLNIEYNSKMVEVTGYAGSYKRGADISFTVTPKEGHTVYGVFFNGQSISPVEGNTYIVKAWFRNEVEILALEEGISKLTLNFDASLNGLDVRLLSAGKNDVEGTISDGKFTQNEIERGSWSLQVKLMNRWVKVRDITVVGDLTENISVYDICEISENAKLGNLKVVNGNLAFTYGTLDENRIGVNIDGAAGDGWAVTKLKISEEELNRINGASDSQGVIATYFVVNGVEHSVGLWFKRGNGSGELRFSCDVVDNNNIAAVNVLGWGKPIVYGDYGLALIGDGLYIATHYNSLTGNMETYMGTNADNMKLIMIWDNANVSFNKNGVVEGFGVSKGFGWNSEVNAKYEVELSYGSTLAEAMPVNEQ